VTSASDDAAAFRRVLGKRLRIARLTQELTQAELGEAAGLSRNFVSLLEHGAHGVDVVRLYRIAAVLGVPLSELVNVPVGKGDQVEGRPS